LIEKWKKLKKYYPLLLILPAFIYVLVWVVYPTFLTLKFSLSEYTLGTPWSAAKFVGLANFKWVFFEDWEFVPSLITTLEFTVVQVVGGLFAGLGIALLLNRITKGRNLMMALFIIPIALMPSMVGLTWRLFYSYDGIVNFFIEPLFGKINWCSTTFALPAILITEFWQWTPFFVLVFFAALTSLPQEPYEAAKIDGASSWLTFKDITLPSLKRMILIVTILRSIEALRSFDIIYTLFGGGPGIATQTLSIHIQRTAFLGRMLGRGSALSLVLVLITLAIIIPMMWYFTRSRS